MTRPKVNSAAQQELDRAQKKFDEFEASVKKVDIDPMAQSTPVEETEPQTKLSSKEIKNSKDIYLRPVRQMGPSPNPKTGEIEKFNEAFREDYEFAKKYVQFIAEHVEISGEDIEIWTKPFQGIPAEEWKVPVNKPVWGPRYLAEQILRKRYSRLFMDEKQITSESGGIAYYGAMKVEKKIHRLNAFPVRDNTYSSSRKVSNF